MMRFQQANTSVLRVIFLLDSGFPRFHSFPSSFSSPTSFFLRLVIFLLSDLSLPPPPVVSLLVLPVCNNFFKTVLCYLFLSCFLYSAILHHFHFLIIVVLFSFVVMFSNLNCFWDHIFLTIPPVSLILFNLFLFLPQTQSPPPTARNKINTFSLLAPSHCPIISSSLSYPALLFLLLNPFTFSLTPHSLPHGAG